MSKVTLTESQINEIILDETYVVLTEKYFGRSINPAVRGKVTALMNKATQIKKIKKSRVLQEQDDSPSGLEYLAMLMGAASIVGGWLPFWGDIVDLVSAALDMSIGDYIGGFIGILAAIPGIGIAFNGVKIALKTGNAITVTKAVSVITRTKQARKAKGLTTPRMLTKKGKPTGGVTALSKDIYNDLIGHINKIKKNTFESDEAINVSNRIVQNKFIFSRVRDVLTDAPFIPKGMAVVIEDGKDLLNVVDEVLDYWLFGRIFNKGYQGVFATAQFLDGVGQIGGADLQPEEIALAYQEYYDAANKWIGDVIFGSGNPNDAPEIPIEQELQKNTPSPKQPQFADIDVDGRSLRQITTDTGLGFREIFAANGIEVPGIESTEDEQNKFREKYANWPQGLESIKIPSRGNK